MEIGFNDQNYLGKSNFLPQISNAVKPIKTGTTIIEDSGIFKVLNMRSVLWKGVGFGLTSGVITTLGVIIGLHSGTHSKLAVTAGIIVLAVADALSDAMGIHVSEEAEMEHTAKEIWQAALFTFMSKFFFALTFLIPITFLELSDAILASVLWGLLLITTFSFYMARSQRQNPYKIVAEHVIITALVVLLAHYVGDLVYEIFAT